MRELGSVGGPVPALGLCDSDRPRCWACALRVVARCAAPSSGVQSVAEASPCNPGGDQCCCGDVAKSCRVSVSTPTAVARSGRQRLRHCASVGLAEPPPRQRVPGCGGFPAGICRVGGCGHARTSDNLGCQRPLGSCRDRWPHSNPWLSAGLAQGE